MSAHKNHLDSSQNSEQSEDFIRPMFQKMPPNQIISERYEPDTSAHFKLILNKDQRRNNLNFIPPKTRNQQLLNYADLFNMFDYLGYNYVNSINQTVYLKFNNSKYNVDPTEKHLTRIMPAFYIPFQHIYNNTQIFFTKNIGLHFPQVYHNSFLPHIKSNKGCSLDPVFNSNYQSSNLFAAIRKNPFQYDLILQNDINSCQKVNWFNFVVQFRSEGYYSFNIANMTTDMSKLFQNGMKISYCYVNDFQNTDNKRTGEGWSLCGQNIKFSKSHIQRQNKKGESYYQLYFQYKCKNKNDVLMFAFQTPYTTMECQKYFNNVTVKKIKNMMILQKIQFGKTISGSPLYSYVLKRKKYRNESFKKFPQSFDLNLQPIKQRNSTNLLPINKLPTSNNLDSRNKSIVILTRMEGSDISGSYILQGIIDYLLENIEYQSLKKTIEFYFIPMVNIDAIKYGNSAANLTGSILHKNWKNPHNIYQSQIFCLKQFLHEINKESPINLILNLGSEHKDIYSSVISIKNEKQQIQDSRIFPHILSRRHKLFSFEKCYFYDKNQNNSMCCVLKDNFPKSLVYQMNISHFQMKKDEEDSSDSFDFGLQLATTDSYRSFGKQLIADYLQHIKISQKNSLLKQKWMREIQEAESKFQRVSPVFMEDKKIEERFLESFYIINNPKSSTNLGEIKSHNNLSHKHIKPPLPQFRRHSKLTKKQNNGPKGANHHAYFELNKANGYFKGSSNTEISQDIKKQQVQDNVEKPVYQVKISNITAKKTSILNNFPPNILNLITQGQSKKYISRQKSRLKIQKQPLKKQLSIRLLKKIKVQDVNRSHKKQQPSTQKSFANF